MFRRCPEQFRHRYILGEKEKPGESLLVGSAFHEGLEFNYLQRIGVRTRTANVAELVEYLQDVACRRCSTRRVVPTRWPGMRAPSRRA